MTSKLFIKTVKDTTAVEPLLAGKHLLILDGFQNFVAAANTITFNFEQENSQVVLNSLTTGDIDKATEIVYEALSGDNGSTNDLDLSSAGYEISDISVVVTLKPGLK